MFVASHLILLDKKNYRLNSINDDSNQVQEAQDPHSEDSDDDK